MKPASCWIDSLMLLPHPEGGYYRETYRSDEGIAAEALPLRYAGGRSFSTAIIFMLEAGQFSAFHRIKSDELWFFHTGLPVEIHIILPDGALSTVRLGLSAADGEQLQAVVPAGSWFAAEPSGDSGYSIVSCTVAPGFDFTDFELADRVELGKKFPQHSELINSLVR